MAIALVRNVGSNAASNSSTVAVTVPASGCAAGNILVVRLYNWSSLTVSSIVDSRSNTYAEFVAVAAGSDRALMWKSLLTTGLQSGDTITTTFSGMANCAACVDEFSGLQNVEDGENTALGTSTTPSVALATTNAENLLVANLGVVNGANDTVTEDTDTDAGGSWVSLTNVTSSTARLHGAYKITTSAVTNTYDPTWSASEEWMLQLGSLKGTVSATGIPSLVTARRI